MKNTYRLIWSDEAIEGLKDIIDYLKWKFSEKDIRKFAKKFDKQIELIRKNPELFPLSSHSKSIRKTTVSKLTSIYFQIENDKIKIISVFDNRKNPDSLEL